VHSILEAVQRIGAKRLVIDSLAGFEMALPPGFRTDSGGIFASGHVSQKARKKTWRCVECRMHDIATTTAPPEALKANDSVRKGRSRR
jgi:hypothetical protein